MKVDRGARGPAWLVMFGIVVVLLSALFIPAQQITETRDPKQAQDEDFAKAYKEWTGEARYGSPLVDHLPHVDGIPTPKDRGFTGLDLPEMFKAKRYKEIAEYCMGDVRATALLYQRWDEFLNFE